LSGIAVSTPPEDKPDGAELPLGRSSSGRRARGPQLTERDGEILRWITRHGLVTAELVGRRFFWRADANDYGRWAAYRRLRALRELGLILNDKPFADHPEVLRVTREGARIADVGLRPAPLVLSELRHSLAVVWLTEYLLAENAGAELTTERELRAERYRELRDGKREPEQGRAPDALLLIPTKGPGAQGVMSVAVELDLTRKDRRTMERIVRQYDRESVDRVWWYVAPARFERTRALVRELRAEDRIEVREWRA
jgi:hypothetical protein